VTNVLTEIRDESLASKGWAFQKIPAVEGRELPTAWLHRREVLLGPSHSASDQHGQSGKERSGSVAAMFERENFRRRPLEHRKAAP